MDSFMNGFNIISDKKNSKTKYKKIRLSLTYETWDLVNQDRFNFSKKIKNETSKADCLEDFKNAIIPIDINTFVNKIFQNYWERANCSLIHKLYNEKKQLANLGFDSNTINNFISKKKNYYKKYYENKYNSSITSVHGYSEFVGLNDTSIAILNNSFCSEAEIFFKKNSKAFDEPIPSPSYYLRAIIEEYTKLPNSTRERIYFNDVYNTICKAARVNVETLQNDIQEDDNYATTSFIKSEDIDYDDIYFEKQGFKGKSVYELVATKSRFDKNNNLFTERRVVYPYKILQDQGKNFNYLICVESLENNPSCENPKDFFNRITTLRISEWDFKISSSEKKYLSSSDISTIENKIKERGVQFLSSKIVNIKIKFTQKGLEHFQKWIYMRPCLSRKPLFEYSKAKRDLNQSLDAPITTNICAGTSLIDTYESFKIDPNNKFIYELRMPEFQVIPYFFKFGRDVEILEPQYLREQFIKRYESALNVYKSND